MIQKLVKYVKLATTVDVKKHAANTSANLIATLFKARMAPTATKDSPPTAKTIPKPSLAPSETLSEEKKAGTKSGIPTTKRRVKRIGAAPAAKEPKPELRSAFMITIFFTKDTTLRI